MNETRKQKLLDVIRRLKERQQQLYDLGTAALNDYNSLPEAERFETLRRHLSDASESLDNAGSLLGGTIEELEMTLNKPAGEIVSGENSEHPIAVEQVKENEVDKPEGKQLSRLAIWWRLFFLLLIFLPLVFFLLYLWLIHDEGAYLGLAAILSIVAVVLLAVLMDKWAKIPDGDEMQGTYDSRPRIHPTTEIMAGMMGAEMIHRAAERERQEAEKRRYDSLYWQESVRDKNPRHDFDYDHLDD